MTPMVARDRITSWSPVTRPKADSTPQTASRISAGTPLDFTIGSRMEASPIRLDWPTEMVPGVSTAAM